MALQWLYINKNSVAQLTSLCQQFLQHHDDVMLRIWDTSSWKGQSKWLLTLSDHELWILKKSFIMFTVCVCTILVEVRVSGVGSLLLPWGRKDWTQVFRLDRNTTFMDWAILLASLKGFKSCLEALQGNCSVSVSLEHKYQERLVLWFQIRFLNEFAVSLNQSPY